jgi:hypothetical protein
VDESEALTDGNFTRTGFELKYEVGPGGYCLPRFSLDGIDAIEVVLYPTSRPRPRSS